jgi:uric acid transporter
MGPRHTHFMASIRSVLTGFKERERTSATHPVDQVLPPGRLAVYGLQHVLAFYAGAVIVPLLLAGAIGLSNEQLIQLISADLFTCGIASIIQSVGFWKVGVRLPLIQGVTFTAVAPMIAIGNAAGGGVAGLLAIYGAVIIAGIFTFLIAPYYSRLLHLFPPVVTGTVITIIGVTLVPVAIQSAGGGIPTAPDFASLKNLAFAAGTLLLILLIYRFFRGFLSTIAVLLGLVIGTSVAAAFGLVDFSGVGKAGWVGVTTPFHFGLPTFGLAAIISMVIVMLITAVETTGDVFATGEIVEKTIHQEDIARALRADGLSTLLGGILNSFPYTCFAENIGLVRLTRVRSRFVVAAAGVIMILLGLLPKVAALVAAIPPPVLGGAATVLFATVAVVGIQTLSRVDFHEERNVVIVAVSIGLAMIPVAFPGFFKNFPSELKIIVDSGITIGSLSAILLNLFFNVLTGKGRLVEEVTPTPRQLEKISLSQVNHLNEKEFVEKFGRLFQGGDWIAESAWQKRPFQSLYELRHAFQDAVFAAPPERQLELIRSYPDLGRMLKPEQASSSAEPSYNVYEAMQIPVEGLLGAESLRDQSSAGLDRLSPEEYESFNRLNTAYRDKFGFPLVVCVRENTKETILASGKDRLENSPAQERATALVEIAKIANLRLQDLIEAPTLEAVRS